MSPAFVIRPETPDDRAAIALVTRAAFREATHSSQTEHLIVDALRMNGALTVSLVAQSVAVPSDSLPGEPTEASRGIIGHVAFSPVAIGGEHAGWFGLGPLSVAPPRQQQGIGTRLVEVGLDELRRRRAAGCVVVGDPHYYERFGFRRLAGLTLAGIPDEYFLALPLSELAENDALADGSSPRVVAYHAAFEVQPPGD